MNEKNGKKILIVEDSALQAEMLKRMLEEKGYSTAIARNGLEGAKMTDSENPDLVISDIAMPLMNGYEMCRKIKKNDKTSKTPVILLTVMTDLRDVIRGLEANADGYITKPYNEEYLLSKIEAFLRTPEDKAIRSTKEGLAVKVNGEVSIVPDDSRRILNLLISTYENAVRQNRELMETQMELKRLNENLSTIVKEQNLKLWESERNYRNLVENSLVGIFKTAFDGKFLYANQAMADIFGFDSPEELMKEGALPRYKNPEERAKIVEILKREGKLDDYELEVITRDGREKSVLTKIAVEEDSLTGMTMDITARKSAEKALRKSNRELQEALEKLKMAQAVMIRQEKLASIGTLSAGVAHEILNPLNIISTIVQQMQLDAPEPEAMAESLAEIMTQIRRATKITNNLRMFAHQKKAEIKELDIHSLLDKTLSLIEHDLNLDNIVIERVYDGDFPLIPADEDLLAQVFLNITNNARYAMRGKKQNLLTLKTKTLGGMVEISFTDSGTGIKKEIINNIFDPFFTTKPPGDGTGMGLSMAYSIIEKHGGTMTVESREGEGATFTIILPVAAPQKSESD